MKSTIASVLATSLLTGCLAGATDESGGAADSIKRKALPLTALAECGDGAEVFLNAESALSVGNIAAVDATINCGAEGIEVCWDGTLGRNFTAATAQLSVRQVGQQTARCVETERLYIDLTDISATFVDEYGDRGPVALSLNQDTNVFFPADLYGGFDHEYSAAIAGAPELRMADIDARKSIDLLMVIRAFNVPVPRDRSFDDIVEIYSRDAAFDFMLRRANAGNMAFQQVADLVAARLPDVAIVSQYNLAVPTSYIVGKTAEGMLAGIVVRGDAP